MRTASLKIVVPLLLLVYIILIRVEDVSVIDQWQRHWASYELIRGIIGGKDGQ